ncbi:hypothetical protein CEXT_490861 [Caerostris extrusa]|uniref:Uncharacterized protein n=1 Tax=Caerostris extrusa TaxID=172846 RepID=A0AAV4XNA7_CAEEX|nr:hypothetical protein CEXT_490861 [Caerostris extrusa]
MNERCYYASTYFFFFQKPSANNLYASISYEVNKETFCVPVILSGNLQFDIPWKKSRKFITHDEIRAKHLKSESTSISSHIHIVYTLRFASKTRATRRYYRYEEKISQTRSIVFITEKISKGTKDNQEGDICVPRIPSRNLQFDISWKKSRKFITHDGIRAKYLNSERTLYHQTHSHHTICIRNPSPHKILQKDIADSKLRLYYEERSQEGDILCSSDTVWIQSGNLQFDISWKKKIPKIYNSRRNSSKVLKFRMDVYQQPHSHSAICIRNPEPPEEITDMKKRYRRLEAPS